jgi:serpin B
MAFLINAIYFKGDWTYQFDPNDTKDEDFTLLDGSTKQVPMMNMQDVSFPYYANEDFQAVDLAYGDSLFSMTIILPRDGTDIDTIIEGLNTNQWEEWIGQFHHTSLESFRMPKFKLEYEIKLNDVLTALGMGIAFNDALADFSRMYHKEQVGLNLFISEVKHKTFIEVNEEGTEAAAVTSVEMAYTSVGPYMIVNRPFIFAIRERFSGTILFIGKIVDPAP